MTKDKNLVNEIQYGPEKKPSVKRKVFRRLGQSTLSILMVALMAGSARAVNVIDTTSTAIGAEGGKQVLNQALKATKGKLALSLAALITCAACAPAAGVAASPALCVACGILISKVIGI